MTTTQSQTATTTAPQATTDVAAQPRLIDGIYRAPPVHWVGDGFRVHGMFSAIPDAVRKLDPFLMLDYGPPHTFTPTDRPRGVGVHPHRGFETVTVAWQGSVEHHDSAGGGGIIGPGDVQWMTAGAGILHKEFHEKAFAKSGGSFHMAQLWVNLPKSQKMTTPRYQPLTAEQMGQVAIDDNAGIVRIIAGEYRGVRGPAETFSPINMWDAQFARAGRMNFVIPSQHNIGLLIAAGDVVVQGDRPASAGSFVVFKNVGEAISIETKGPAQVLVLSGEPLREPIVQYGPFVMNTDDEIRQAFTDFRAGKFGRLDD